MQKFSKEARIIIACAILLAAIDIYVRFSTAPKAVSSSVVTAQEFRLTDKAGNVRAVMNTDRNGEPGLVMYDRRGTPRLQIDSFETTPSLILMDERGQRRAYYGMSSPTGDGAFTFYGSNGASVANLSIADSVPSFSLSGDNSQAVWNISGDSATASVPDTKNCEQ